MLASLLFALIPQKATELPAYMGRATHSWFMEQIRLVDPALSAALHEPNQDRPFAVSDLWGTNLASQGTNQIKPDTTCYLRIATYHPRLATLLAGEWSARPPATIQLAHCRFEVKAATVDPSASPWAGQSSFEELIQTQRSKSEVADQITLIFAAPTVFRSKGNYMPLPLPRLVFEGLIRQWNDAAPSPVPQETINYIEENLVISRYQLQSERVDRGKRGGFPGFIGTCTYALRVRDRYWMGLVHQLAQFGFYTGVGRETAMGLGQMRME